MVCPQDYEPKSPQIEPLNYRGDAIALRDPRTDRRRACGCVRGFTGRFSFPNSIGSANYTAGTTKHAALSLLNVPGRGGGICWAQLK